MTNDVLTTYQQNRTTMNPINIKVKLDPGATMPTRAHDRDTGLDICANAISYRVWDVINRNWRIAPGNLRRRPFPPNNPWQVVIDTGVHVQPEDGYAFEGRPNSRNRDHLFRWVFSPATIDQNYTGSIKITLEPRFPWVTFDDAPKQGEVCAQLVLERVYKVKLIQVDELTHTDRADGGFGSTAKR